MGTKNRQYEMFNLYDNKEMLLTEWVEEHGNRDLQDKFKRYLESRDNSKIVEPVIATEIQ
jgi:hypothetical protein